MVVGSCHGVRRIKEGPGQAHNDVETLVHRAWVTHQHCPMALQQSVMGEPADKCEQKKLKKWNLRGEIVWILVWRGSDVVVPIQEPRKRLIQNGMWIGVGLVHFRNLQKGCTNN